MNLSAVPRVPDPLDHVLASPRTIRAGLWLEFGVFRGASLAKLAFNSGAARVVGFDSFEGLPEDWRPGLSKGHFACEPPRVEGAEIVVGRFEDTLPRFDFTADVTLAHIDCDVYASAACALKYIKPHLVPGSIVVFDELMGYEGFEQHEWRALEESGIALEWICVGGEPCEKAAGRIGR